MTPRDQGLLFAELELAAPPNPSGRNGSAQLDELQLRFVDEYLIDLNGTRAVVRAGYKCKSDAVASVQAHRLLSNAKVQAELRRRLGDRVRASQLTIEGVLEQLRKLAYADIRTMYNADGTLKSIHDMPSDISARVLGIEVLEVFEGSGNARRSIGYLKKVKLTSPAEPLTLICKYLGMLVEGRGDGDGATVIPGNYRDLSDAELVERAYRLADMAGAP